MQTRSWRVGAPRMLSLALLALALGPGTSLLNHGDSLLPRVLSAVLGTGWAWACAGMLAGYLAGPRRRVGAAAGTAVLVLAVAGYYLADHLQGTYANLPGLPTDLVSDPVASSLRDAGLWTVGALLTGPPLGVLGALGQRAGVGGLLARLGAPALAIAELGMLVVTGTPRTALEETAQIARTGALVLAIGWAVVLVSRAVPRIRRARRAADGAGHWSEPRTPAAR